MRIVYFDESGDDGYPHYSSPLFALTAVYMHYLQWQANLGRIREFRSQLRRDYGVPVKTEIHTKYFILNKRPYRGLGLAQSSRLRVIDLLADLVGSLELRVVNVVINKPAIQRDDYQVLDTALRYAVQRIENDLDSRLNPAARFLAVTDEGRVGAMRSTTRRIQRINYIPSRFGAASYRREITTMIEDPLPKDSRESYFIQVADFVAFIVYLYALELTGSGRPHGRMPEEVTSERIGQWMQRMSRSLNTQAAADDRFGVKIHPR
jgi:hypothetical protein